jgi:hypothetical protein
MAESKKIDERYLDDVDFYENMHTVAYDVLHGILLDDVTEIVTRYVAYPDYLTKASEKHSFSETCTWCNLPLVNRMYGYNIAIELAKSVKYYMDLGHKILTADEYCNDIIHHAVHVGYSVFKCTDPKCDKYGNIYTKKCMMCNKESVDKLIICKNRYVNGDPSKILCFYVHVGCFDMMRVCGDEFEVIRDDEAWCMVH